MKSLFSKPRAKAAIDSFFQRQSWTADEMRKLKRLAMKHRIKFGAYRRMFCKKCCVPLRGSIRITKTHKTIICGSCGAHNRHALTH